MGRADGAELRDRRPRGDARLQAGISAPGRASTVAGKRIGPTLLPRTRPAAHQTAITLSAARKAICMIVSVGLALPDEGNTAALATKIFGAAGQARGGLTTEGRGSAPMRAVPAGWRVSVACSIRFSWSGSIDQAI